MQEDLYRSGPKVPGFKDLIFQTAVVACEHLATGKRHWNENTDLNAFPAFLSLVKTFINRRFQQSGF